MQDPGGLRGGSAILRNVGNCVFTLPVCLSYNLYMSLGARIKELRTLSALSQAQLAEKIGVNTSAVSLWENDVNEPKASYIARLALALDVSADYLLGIEDEAGGRVRVQPQALERYGEDKP